MAKRLFAFGSRPLWGAIAAALTMAVLLSFSPVQSWAQKVLLMLRAQKVAVVPVDFSAVATANDGDSRKLLAQLVSDEVTVTMDPGKPTSAATIDAASQAAGFQVKTLPNAGSPTKISVSNEGAFQMTLDRDRMQAVLDQAGRSDIQIPASVDGSLVAVHVPRIVHLQYGNCNATNGSAPQTNSTDTSCMHFVEAPSPTVSVPPGLDVSALAEAGLQVAGMSAADAHSFTQTIDWSSTLVVPIPQGRSSYQQASVDGVNGTVIEMPQRGSSPGRYLLLWVKNGIIYSLEGYGNSSTALAVAATLS